MAVCRPSLPGLLLLSPFLKQRPKIRLPPRAGHMQQPGPSCALLPVAFISSTAPTHVCNTRCSFASSHMYEQPLQPSLKLLCLRCPYSSQPLSTYFRGGSFCRVNTNFIYLSRQAPRWCGSSLARTSQGPLHHAQVPLSLCNITLCQLWQGSFLSLHAHPLGLVVNLNSAEPTFTSSQAQQLLSLLKGLTLGKWPTPRVHLVCMAHAQRYIIIMQIRTTRADWEHRPLR